MVKLIDIKIVSDPVCPWCYIGLSRLNKAISQSNTEITFKKTFITHQLHPWMQEKGMSQKTLLEMKYGSAKTKGLSSNLRAAAEAEGITINYGNIKKVPNTFIAHLLIKEAQKLGKAELVYGELFKAFFENGSDIGDLQILQQISDKLDLQIDLQVLVQDKKKKEAVKEEEQSYRNKGIAAVPAFIINDKQLVEGAQKSDYFCSIFNQLIA